MTMEEMEEMTRSEKIKTTILMILFFVLTLVALFACSSPQTVTVERVRTDTCYQTRFEHDSIFIRDSVYTVERISGDTVWVMGTRWRTEWRERLRIDTTYISRMDSVPVVVEVPVEVPAPLTMWQQTRMGIGTLAMVFLIVIAGMKALAIFRP